ncbi:MAG: hypothetical protein H6R26_30 [Proteobacteria bacterium]|nr:hypothetical protein [Pseudomonadota bacterium]
MSSRGKTFSKYPDNSVVRRLDRIECPHCRMAIIPRLAFYDGTPTKSVCPFCAGIVRDFRKPGKGRKWVRYLITGVAIVIGIQVMFLVKSSSDSETGPMTTAEQRDRR